MDPTLPERRDGIQMAVSGPGFDRRGLVFWPAFWIVDVPETINYHTFAILTGTC